MITSYQCSIINITVQFPKIVKQRTILFKYVLIFYFRHTSSFFHSNLLPLHYCTDCHRCTFVLPRNDNTALPSPRTRKVSVTANCRSKFAISFYCQLFPFTDPHDDAREFQTRVLALDSPSHSAPVCPPGHISPLVHSSTGTFAAIHRVAY